MTPTIHASARRVRIPVLSRRRLTVFLIVAALVGPGPGFTPAEASNHMKPVIWVANSGEGTISLLDTRTGVEMGRYRTGPAADWPDPSRTTVDLDAGVWVANRGTGTAVKYNHPDNCIAGSRSGSTSSGSTPLPYLQDDCLVVEVFAGAGARGVAVDRNNDVWIGSYNAWPQNYMRKFRGSDGAQLDQLPIPYGAYGALLDREGYLWVAHGWYGPHLTRIDVRDPASSTYGDQMMIQIPTGVAYGIGADLLGHIWVTDFYQTVYKIDAASGSILGGFNHGQTNSQGVVADLQGDVWVAGSLSGSTVARLDNAGNLLAVIPVGSGPTGVAVDVDGKVWTANINSWDASRISPVTGTVDGTFPVGQWPYNYSDMTGFVLHHVTVGDPPDGFDPCREDRPHSPPGPVPPIDDPLPDRDLPPNLPEPPPPPGVDLPPTGIAPPELPDLIKDLLGDSPVRLADLIEDLFGDSPPELPAPPGAGPQGAGAANFDEDPDGEKPVPGDELSGPTPLCPPPVPACIAVGLDVRINTSPEIRSQISRSAAAVHTWGGMGQAEADTAVSRADIPPALGAGALETRCFVRGWEGGGYAEGEAEAARFSVDLSAVSPGLTIEGSVLREEGAAPPGANSATVADLTVGGTPVASVAPGPNETVSLPGGITVFINEQRVTPHPWAPCAVFNGNALRVTVADPLTGGTLAEVIVSYVATVVC